VLQELKPVRLRPGQVSAVSCVTVFSFIDFPLEKIDSTGVLFVSLGLPYIGLDGCILYNPSQIIIVALWFLTCVNKHHFLNIRSLLH